MKYRILIAFISLLFIFTSCSDEENLNRINGVITKYPEYEPINGAKVTLKASVYEQGSYSINYETLYKQKTNKNGKFDFKFDKIRVNKYLLKITHPGYRDLTKDFSPDEIVTNYNFEGVMVLNSTLKVNIRNEILPVSENDFLRIRIKDMPVECISCSSNKIIMLEGANIDTSLNYKVAGKDSVFLEYTYQKEGSTKYNYESIFCSEGENTFTISY